MDRLAYIQILEKHLLPLISTKFNEKGYLFQQDNAPVHTVKDVKYDKEDQNFAQLAKSIT